ncbi:MAG: hypothetical protein ACREBF_01955, partial [Candidatus Micrarchaeales archaeon]
TDIVYNIHRYMNHNVSVFIGFLQNRMLFILRFPTLKSEFHMYNFSVLKIIGNDKTPFENTMIKTGKKTDKLAILFPGMGYTCRMPLLYYATAILLGSGFDVLWAEHAYNKNKKFSTLSQAKQNNLIANDVSAIYNAVKNQGTYKNLVLLGKSIGTVAVGELLRREQLPKNLKIIWLTPLLNRPNLVDIMKNCAHENSLTVIGTKDPHYNLAELKSIQKMNKGRLLIIKNVDHGLENDEDFRETLSALGKFTESVKKFV